MFFCVLKLEPTPIENLKNFFRSTFILLLFCSVCNAQVVDKSVSGIQTGLLGIWWHNESRIAPNWALPTEIGYAAPVYARVQYREEATGNHNYFYPVFQPVLSLEPRFYYNSGKRQGNSNNTFHNSGNYLSFAFQYYPKFLAYSPKGNSDEFLAFDAKEPNGGLYFIPTWGIRRNISYRLNFELGAGFGIDLIEAFNLGTSTSKEIAYVGNDFIFNVHLRFGYKYGMKE